jgi:hypothetical protein
VKAQPSQHDLATLGKDDFTRRKAGEFRGATEGGDFD